MAGLGDYGVFRSVVSATFDARMLLRLSLFLVALLCAALLQAQTAREAEEDVIIAMYFDTLAPVRAMHEPVDLPDTATVYRSGVQVDLNLIPLRVYAKRGMLFVHPDSIASWAALEELDLFASLLKRACKRPMGGRRLFDIAKLHHQPGRAVRAVDPIGTGRDPHFWHVVRFSRVAFDAEMTRACFYADVHCGLECAAGSVYFVQKVDGQWRTAGSTLLWIS